MQFTPEQTLAIERREGELLLDAGAGSGKTSVLVERFARAVERDSVGVNQILTITFTEKAAAELRERIRIRLRTAGDDVAARATEGAWISTIHAFCARLLRAHALDAGLDPEFVVLDEQDAVELRRGAFDAALGAWARTEMGAELIAAHGPGPLRTTITELHAELRARGALDPQLPPAPEPPSAIDMRAACRLVEQLGGAVQRELGALGDPGVRVTEALTMLERVPDVLASGRPWPGEIERIRLGQGAAVLKTQACDDYRAAVDELGEMAAETFAPATRDAFDALLREYSARYAALKRRRSALDFSDLELLARELLKREEIGSRYRERFTRVMVDEMQDTNRVQLELIDLVAGPNVFMVGDAQQSIYGFRHADVELFEARGARLEQLDCRASLQTNFRSRPEILAALNGAFTTALGERFKPLLPGRAEAPTLDPMVELILVDKAAIDPEPDPLVEHPAAAWRVAEARALAARVRELMDMGEARARDIVVLLRATTDMHVYEQALERELVPTYVIGGRGYWAHPQVIELVAYLRALANPLDTDALYGVLLSPLCGLSLDGLVLYSAGASEELDERDRDCLAAFETWFEQERRAAAWLGAEQLLDRAISHNGYELHMAGLPDARRRLANVRKLMRLARDWQGAHGSDLRGFVDLLQARAGGGERESEAPVEGEALDAVRLMTIHRSKGLEFPVVCVADLGRQVVPRVGALVKVGRDGVSLGLRLRRPGFAERVNVLAYDEAKVQERELEFAEERRLFYVAMTRAKERLIVSGAAKLEAWEDSNRFAPIGWVGAAFVPDIGARATAATASATSGPPRFVTDLGVRVSFVTKAEQPDSVDVFPLQGGKRRQSRETLAPTGSPRRQSRETLAPTGSPPPVPTAAPASDAGLRPTVPTLSCTALATYEQCGYRFYVQRVLGLADAPTPTSGPAPMDPPRPGPPRPGPPGPPDALGPPDAPATTPEPAPTHPTMSGAERGTLIHQLLAGLDLRRPSLADPMPADIHELLTGLIVSSTFARLAGLEDVRREQRFAFPIGETLITGAFDVLARERERDRLLVVDYKSDRLGGGDPQAIVTERYIAQRTIYALAALKLGAAEVEITHLFLEAPEDPVCATFMAADAPILEADLAQRVAGVGGSRSGNFMVTNTPGRRVCDGCPAQDGLCSYPLEVTSR